VNSRFCSPFSGFAIPAFLLAIASIANSTTKSCVADEQDWKLQPLPYNHPGLEVDLGVGLWAYPLPLDYDQDGDMDLLVACPDKPSNGIYFFENPSSDPENPMPVFKPGVRLGNGEHYMMLSMLGDEPVILAPQREFRRDPQTGQFDFKKPRQLNAPKNPHAQASGRIRANMWRYVDYDGDGDHDLVMGIGDWTDLGWDHAYDNRGVWRNGPLHGFVYLAINSGSDQSPQFSQSPHRLHAGGGEIDVYGWPSPDFADFDGDGDLDLMCGEFMDGFTYFQNIGTRQVPRYAAGQKLIDENGQPLTMHLQMITPTAIDWDRDGDVDLIVGDEDGRVAFVENTGKLHDGQPVFANPAYFRQQADTLKFGALATPFAYDWDADGDQDILCGNTAGEIGFFENLGAGPNGLPKWNEPTLLEVNQADGSHAVFRVMAGESGSIQGPCEAKWGYTTLSVADWDGDGRGDIVYNSILSRVGLLIRDSNGMLTDTVFDSGMSESPPAWYWWQTKSSSALTQWRTTPVVIDFDADAKLDLVMLDQQGYLTLRRGGGTAERVFVDEDNAPIRLNAGTCGRSGRVKLAVVDWDGDSRLDVLTNSENAIWYRNCEDREGKIVLKKIGNLARRNVAGHTSSPAICDFNSDGQPDLLIGSENGRIYHIHHDDCVSFTDQKLTARPAKLLEPTQLTGMLQQGFVFEKAPFNQCHASTVCSNSRGLVAAWFGGTQEGHDDVGIWSSYHDGLAWSSPIQVADGVQHDGLRYPCWNPVLYQPPGDAPTLLFYKVGKNPRQWWGEIRVSYDRGRTFGVAKRLPEDILGPVRCKPLLLADGETLLCGSSTEHDGWRVHFESTKLVDGQISDWKRIGPIEDASRYNAIQPTLLKQPDGMLLALSRTREDVIVSSTSKDQGKSWSQLQPIELPNPNSGIDAVTLHDGRHLLVYNPLASDSNGWGNRGVLSLAVSDDGVQWRDVGVLDQEKDAEFSYPAIIQAEDGSVHITYTWKRKRIRYVEIDPTLIPK
jgi:predicted neuraminidase